jgi:hypothetical protein
MKYFTQELYRAAASDDIETSTKAEKQWDKNLKAYWKYVARIAPRLAPQARRFFTKTSLHDGRIESISIGDTGRYSRSAANFAEIKVRSAENDSLYTLHYSWVRDLRIEYHGDRRYRGRRRCLFEDWLYDEVFLTRDKWMRHELWLSSDMTVFIEFKHFQYKVDKCGSTKVLVRK